MSAPRRLRIFQILAVVAAVAAYLTVVIGGDVRSSGAGMACGDAWPFCSSGVIPDFSIQGVAIEFAHRVAAFLTSILILVTLLLAYVWYRHDPKIIVLATASMALLVSQVWLGQATVAQGLDPTIVTAHLAVGTATFATALALAVTALVAPPGARTQESATHGKREDDTEVGLSNP